jgi:tetratricopeptide (TPR) repeat protein
MKISKGGDKGESTIIPLRNIADIYESLGDDNKSLDFFLKAKKNLSNNNNPEEHFYIESSIGYLKFYLSNYDECILHFIDAINIYSNHSSINYLSKNINTIYYYLGYSYYYKSEYLSAEKILINLSKLTINDLPIDDFIDNNKLIGNCFFYLEKYTEAIESYNKIIYYQKDGFSILETLKLIASCYEYLNENNKALDYYIKSAEIHKNHKNIDLNHEATQESISNAKRLGKELNKESELPEWMR